MMALVGAVLVLCLTAVAPGAIIDGANITVTVSTEVGGGSFGSAAHLVDGTGLSGTTLGVDLYHHRGVDLAKVTKIEIGVGTPGGSSSIGIGNLYIDDVGLCAGGPVPQGCVCPGDLNNDTQIDLDDLQAVAGMLLDAGSGAPGFIVAVEQGHCGDLNADGQADLDDLQAVASNLLDAGSPYYCLM